jgi:hypothetical protein
MRKPSLASGMAGAGTLIRRASESSGLSSAFPVADAAAAHAVAIANNEEIIIFFKVLPPVEIFAGPPVYSACPTAVILAELRKKDNLRREGIGPSAR